MSADAAGAVDARTRAGSSARRSRGTRAGSRRRAGRDRRLPRPLAVVGHRARGVLGVDLGLLRRARLGRRTSASSDLARDAGRRVVPRCAAQLRGARPPRPRRRRGRDPPRVGASTPRRGDLGRARATGRAASRRRSVRRGSRPGDRVVAYLPNIVEAVDRVPRVRQSRRDLVELLARLRRPQRRRPIRADRAPRSSSRSTATATAARTTTGSRSSGRSRRRCRRSSERSSSAISTREPDLDRLPPCDVAGTTSWTRAATSELDVRAGSVRPPALGALQLRHDRPAEGDRPRPRRDPARDAEEDAPARRPAGGRPAVLVHDDRLDDVELRRRRASHRRVDRALRRQPRPSRPGHALEPRRGGRHHVFRHVGELHRRVHEGRRRSTGRARPLAARGGRVDGLPALAGGVRLGLRPARPGRLALLDLGRDGCLHGVRRRRADAARLPRRAPGARARRQGRGVERRRASRSSARWASS